MSERRLPVLGPGDATRIGRVSTLPAFGIYLLGLRWRVVLVTNLALDIFHIRSTSEFWIRVIGVLLLILGSYDILAARAELR